VKDIVFWQSATAREREKRHLSELAALHQSTVPPGELLRPVPRKLRWKKSLKFGVAFEVVFLVLALCMTIWFCMRVTRFDNEMAQFFHQSNERTRHKAAQTTDPKEKAKLDKHVRESEEFDRKLHTLHVVTLASICMMVFVFPLAHATLNWFINVRPNLLLLRGGAPVRASIIQRKRTFPFFPAVEFGFTTDRGEHIRRTQLVVRSETLLFNVGDSVWVLYLPRRPKTAQIYGLKSALAEVIAT
jgi:hypothetical protein